MIKDLSHGLRVVPSRDERTRQEFVASLRLHILADMAASMRARYEQRVLPRFQQEHGRSPADGDEVHDAMQDER